MPWNSFRRELIYCIQQTLHYAIAEDCLYMSQSAVVASVIHPYGRTVVLDSGGWQHILSEHPEMAGYQMSILDTITHPDGRYSDPRVGRERYCRQNMGPSRWCFVVIDFNESPPVVVTAFGIRRIPQGWQRL